MIDDEEKLEAIRQTYETSVINFKEASRIKEEKAKLLQKTDNELKMAQKQCSILLEQVSKNRTQYEIALYEFWELCNE